MQEIKIGLIEFMFKGCCLLAMIIFIGGFGYLGVAILHDTIYQENEYKSEFLLLDDVQYMDDGNILYRFGDLVIKDTLIKDNFNVKENYEVVYIKYKNSWLNENNVWKYYEIKSPT